MWHSGCWESWVGNNPYGAIIVALLVCAYRIWWITTRSPQSLCLWRKSQGFSRYKERSGPAAITLLTSTITLWPIFYICSFGVLQTRDCSMLRRSMDRALLAVIGWEPSGNTNLSLLRDGTHRCPSYYSLVTSRAR